MSTGVLLFDVETQPDDAGVGFGFATQLVEERPKNPLPAIIGMDVHALQPPDVAVAPVAPFVSVHKLTHRAASIRGDEVTSLARIGQQRPHTRFDMRAVECFPLALFGQQAVEFNNNRPVVSDSRTDSNGHGWFPWFS